MESLRRHMCRLKDDIKIDPLFQFLLVDLILKRILETGWNDGVVWLRIVTSISTEPSSYTKCEEIFTSWTTNNFRYVCCTQVITQSSAIKLVIDNHVTLIRRVSSFSRSLNLHCSIRHIISCLSLSFPAACKYFIQKSNGFTALNLYATATDWLEHNTKK